MSDCVKCDKLEERVNRLELDNRESHSRLHIRLDAHSEEITLLTKSTTKTEIQLASMERALEKLSACVKSMEITLTEKINALQLAPLKSTSDGVYKLVWQAVMVSIAMIMGWIGKKFLG